MKDSMKEAATGNPPNFDFAEGSDVASSDAYEAEPQREDHLDLPGLELEESSVNLPVVEAERQRRSLLEGSMETSANKSLQPPQDDDIRVEDNVVAASPRRLDVVAEDEGELEKSSRIEVPLCEDHNVTPADD